MMLFNKKTICSIFAVLLLVSCESELIDQATFGTLTGTVLDEETQAPLENAKVSIRNARKEANNEIRKSDASDDMKSNFEIDIQNITDKYTSKIDSIFSTKEKEILSV